MRWSRDDSVHPADITLINRLPHHAFQFLGIPDIASGYPAIVLSSGRRIAQTSLAGFAAAGGECGVLCMGRAAAADPAGLLLSGQRGGGGEDLVLEEPNTVFR